MSTPANIRVNIGAPFPSLVKAVGPATISKRNGIWTVGFSFSGLGQLPVNTPPAQVQLLVYNTANDTFQVTTVAALTGSQLSTTVVTHAMSPYAPTSSDLFLLVDTTGGPVEIDLALAGSRVGAPLSIKDYKGNAAVNNITIKPQGAPANETIDGYTNANPLVLSANYDGVRLLPITSAYTIAP